MPPSSDHQHDLDIAKVAQRSKDIEAKLPKLKDWMEQRLSILALVKTCHRQFGIERRRGLFIMRGQ
jgi:hypothetical protein